MKKGWITIIVVVVLVLFLFLWIQGTYNKMITRSETVTEKWADVNVAYQARMDKTLNLMKIVEGSANFEKSTLTEVVNARARATSVTVDPDKLTPENINKFQQAQDAFGQTLSKLMVVVEKYPEIKSTENFREFQSQYEGMENRIAVARKNFNQVVKEYNVYIKRFPANMFAAMFGFEAKGYFEAAEGAEKAPDIEFDLK
jgi:LemA protein